MEPYLTPNFNPRNRWTKYALILLLLGSLSIVFAQEADTLQQPEKQIEPASTIQAGNSIAQQLQSERWVLTKVLKIKNDTLTNVSSTLIKPCDKDNFVQYGADNTYGIYEGDIKCDEAAGEVRGKGTWEMKGDSVIVDRYQEGRRIPKRITSISKHRLIISFEARGGTKMNLTYLVPEAIEHPEVLAEESAPELDTTQYVYDDPNDFREQIEELILNTLEGSGVYVLVTPEQIETGRLPDIPEEVAPYRKIVSLLSVTDQREEEEGEGVQTDATEEFINSIKGKGVDYFVTASLDKTESEIKKTGIVADVTYSLNIWNGTSGELISKEDILGNRDGATGKAIGNTFLDVAKTTLIIADAADGTNNSSDTRGMIQDLDEWKTDINSDMASIGGMDSSNVAHSFLIQKETKQAIKNSRSGLESVIAERLPLTFKIHSITQYHKKKEYATELKIVAGSLAKISEKEVLEVYAEKQESIAPGITTTNTTLVATLIVTRVDNAHLSVCKVKGGNQLLTEKMKEDKSTLKVRTVGKKSNGIFMSKK